LLTEDIRANELIAIHGTPKCAMSGDGYATSPDRSVKQALNCRVSRICAGHFCLHTLLADGVDDARSDECSFMLVKDNYERDCLTSDLKGI
jgi:hypothetical protein